jgi:hypothetical protein
MLVSNGCLETCAMSLPELAVPAASAAVVMFAFVRRAVRRDEPDHDRALRLFAGIAHIVLRDKRSRARRAMDVLRLLRRERLAAVRSRAEPSLLLSNRLA